MSLYLLHNNTYGLGFDEISFMAFSFDAIGLFTNVILAPVRSERSDGILVEASVTTPAVEEYTSISLSECYLKHCSIPV